MDTLALIAIMDRDDAGYAEAKQTWSMLTARRVTLVTTSHVLLETVAILQSRIGVRVVCKFNDESFPS